MLLRCLTALVIAVFSVSCTKKNEPGAEKKQVNLFIWSNYISDELLKEFEAKNGIKVNVSNYASNEELLAKLQAGATGYDVIVPSDYMVSIMAKLDLLLPLDKSLIPNQAGVDAKFRGLEFDKENKFSLPYGWATSGIAVNTSLLKEPIKSWKDLFENPKLKGKVSMLDDNREVYAAALKALGLSLNTTKKEDIDKAHAYLKKHKAQIKAFNSDPLESIMSGDIWAAQMYSPDTLQAASKTAGKVVYVIPEEGCTYAIDNVAIPKSAKNVAEAHALINFMLDTKSNVNFVSTMMAGPVLTSTKEMLPPELKANAGLFPAENVMSKLEMMLDIGEATEIYDRLWTELKAN